MIAHREFSRLRLAEFCSKDPQYVDYEDEHGDLLVEAIRGIEFFRHARVESGTLIVEIDLLDYSTDVGPEILHRIGIPLTKSSELSDAIQSLGDPVSSRIGPDRGYDYFRTDYHEFSLDGEEGYEVRLVWLHPGEVGRPPPLRVEQVCLWSVRIARADLSSYPWNDD